MSARDDLADLLAAADANYWDKSTAEPNWQQIADAVISAGWRPPAQTVETVEELEALPEGTVIRNRFGDVFEVLPTSDSDLRMGFWLGDEAFQPSRVRLPAIVLWEPGDGDE